MHVRSGKGSGAGSDMRSGKGSGKGSGVSSITRRRSHRSKSCDLSGAVKVTNKTIRHALHVRARKQEQVLQHITELHVDALLEQAGKKQPRQKKQPTHARSKVKLPVSKGWGNDDDEFKETAPVLISTIASTITSDRSDSDSDSQTDESDDDLDNESAADKLRKAMTEDPVYPVVWQSEACQTMLSKQTNIANTDVKSETTTQDQTHAKTATQDQTNAKSKMTYSKAVSYSAKQRKPRADALVAAVRTEYGLVSKGYLNGITFVTLVTLAKEIHEKGYTIFGSFARYTALCLSVGKDPFTEDTTKWWLQDKSNFIPNDIDVLDPNETFPGETFHTVTYVQDLEVDEWYDASKTSDGRTWGMRFEHVKSQFKGPFDVEVTIDVARRIKNADFDINTLVLVGGKDARITTHPFNSFDQMSLIARTQEAIEVSKIIDATKNKKATLIKPFLAGTDRSGDRLSLVGRLLKHWLLGFTITNFLNHYCIEVIEKNDAVGDRTCRKCRAEIAVGDNANILQCCRNNTSLNVLCMDCFWESMKKNAERGRFYTCPFCCDRRLIFPEHANPSHSDQQ